jgi:hypothetical protein
MTKAEADIAQRFIATLYKALSVMEPRSETYLDVERQIKKAEAKLRQMEP